MLADRPRRLLAAVLGLALFLALAPQARAASLPPAPKGPDIYVNDFAQLLSPEHAQSMASLARALDRATGAQLVVVTVESLGGTSIEEYALKLFRTWGIGQKDKNNGVLLLVNKENLLAGRPGRVRIEVGYGLEGAIPDGLAGRILDEEVLPAWKNGEYSEGIYRGFLALAGAIAQEYGLDLSQHPEMEPLASYAASATNGGDWGEIIAVLAFLAFFGSLAWLGSRRRHFRGPGGPFWGWPGGFGSFGGFGGGGFGGGGFGGGSSGGGGASR